MENLKEYYPATVQELEAKETAPATRSIAKRIREALPWCPANVALTAALALTAESVVGLSPLTLMRLKSHSLDETLDQVTENFVLAIKAACIVAGLTAAQFGELLHVAEFAAIADVKEQQSKAERPQGATVN